MARKLFFIVTVLTVTAGFITASLAFEPGDDRKGKYMFRKTCRACHIDGGTAKALSPNSKTQAQWEKTFEKYERYQCAAEWNKLTPEDRNNMLTYLYSHAIDSPSPATCE